jgi:hypothetical protein
MTPTIFFRWIAWLLVLAIAIFTLSPNELRPSAGTSTLSTNLERFAAFTVIGTLFNFAYPRHRFAAILLVIGIVASLEVAQNFVPSRHGRLPDGLLKTAGGLLGFAGAMFATEKRLLRRRHSRMTGLATHRGPQRCT